MNMKYLFNAKIKEDLEIWYWKYFSLHLAILCTHISQQYLPDILLLLKHLKIASNFGRSKHIMDKTNFRIAEQLKLSLIRVNMILKYAIKQLDVQYHRGIITKPSFAQNELYRCQYWCK